MKLFTKNENNSVYVYVKFEEETEPNKVELIGIINGAETDIALDSAIVETLRIHKEYLQNKINKINEYLIELNEKLI